MEVSEPNNVKIYNLSAGKRLPEWLSERKKRALQRKDVDVRRRIELIQDFDMPGVSTNVRISPDGQFVVATGIYKPRVKCFDVNHLSMKFERCFDSEVVAFQILSQDYSKMVFLQCDRYLEFHSAAGRYYRLRIPKFGRDLQYHFPSCDLFVAGVTSDIYRLNLERGQFLMPFVSDSSEVNKLSIGPGHQMLMCGTKEGMLEAWDPRTRNKIGILDCAFHCMDGNSSENFPSITAITFQNNLIMGVGTATGQILLYDIRANRPFLIKDHMYGLPIKSIEFENNQNLVLSMDSSVLKIWNKDSGKIFTSIESKSDLNDLCFVKNTGMIFMANESTKILAYYIPGLGPAPKWCGFLDSLTEELEESKTNTIYDDYKFVTRKELEDLGLSHLLGTTLLRAYMHGFFMDVRLYKKAKSLSEPFAFERYRKKKIRQEIEEERKNRVKVEKLPNVNKDLALKLMNDCRRTSSLLGDERFAKLFCNPDFQIDKNADEFRLINPVLSKLDKRNERENKKNLEDQFDEIDSGEKEGCNSSEDVSSDEDDEQLKEEIKRQHAEIRREKRQKEREERKANLKFYELKEGEDFKGVGNVRRRTNKASLGDRVALAEKHEVLAKGHGSREMKFHVKRDKRDSRHREKAREHHAERRRLHRPATGLMAKAKPKFWKGKRMA